MHPRPRLIAAALAIAAFAPACASAAGPPRTDAAGITWLCRPGLAHDPCVTDLSTRTFNADGTSMDTEVDVEPSVAAHGPQTKVDCFYVYPTVSGQKTTNANLTIDPAETSVAIDQAARFSGDCRVWAPMYRQLTVAELGTADNFAHAQAVAYDSLLAGFKDYLANDNHGRPIVFIGHSQGSAMLIELLRNEVDNNAELRGRMISAVLAGGNVTVRNGSDRGGSFQHIPACRKPKQTGCVIAYSTFLTTPPPTSFFGIPGLGVSVLSLSPAVAGTHVLCVNPAALGGGQGTLIPEFRGTGTPLWNSYSKLYTAQCSNAGGANVLHVNVAPAGATDTRPRVTETLGPNWGLHLFDVNLALGNLTLDVGAQETAYLKAHRSV